MASVSNVVWDSNTNQFLITLDGPSLSADAFGFSLTVTPDYVDDGSLGFARTGTILSVSNSSYNIFDTGNIISAVSSVTGNVYNRLILPDGTTSFRTNRDFGLYLNLNNLERDLSLSIGNIDDTTVITSEITGTKTIRLLSGVANVSLVGSTALQTFTATLDSSSSDWTYYPVSVTDDASYSYVTYYDPRSTRPYYITSDGYLTRDIVQIDPGVTVIAFDVGAPSVENNAITMDFAGTTSTILGSFSSGEIFVPSGELPETDPPPGSATLTSSTDNIAYDYSTHLDRIVTALDQIAISQAEMSSATAGILTKLSSIDTNIDALKEAGDPRSIGDGIRVTQPYGQLYLAYLWKEILQGGFLDGYSDSVTDDDVVDLLNKLENHDNAKLINQQVKLINDFILQIQSKFNAY